MGKIIIDEDNYLRDDYLIQFRGETPPRNEFLEAVYGAEGEFWTFVGFIVEDICYKHDNPMIDSLWFPKKRDAEREYKRRVRESKIRCPYCLKEGANNG